MKGYLGWVVGAWHFRSGSVPPWPPDHREPCGDWLLGKLQRNAHHRARARTRALLLFQLRDALVSAPGPQPALYTSGAPLWG